MSTSTVPTVNIRPARQNDNFLSIARCLYLTDPFIYPAAFGPDANIAANAITKLMMIDGNLFDYRRLIVADIDGQIKGVLMYSEQGTTWNQLLCEETIRNCIHNMNNFQYVSKAYFSEVAAISQSNHVEIVACCIAPEARRQGLANRMLQYIVEEKHGCTMSLDVLADNKAAITLYTKCGFVISRSYKGFSLALDARPNCYHMERNAE